MFDPALTVSHRCVDKRICIFDWTRPNTSSLLILDMSLSIHNNLIRLRIIFIESVLIGMEMVGNLTIFGNYTKIEMIE